MHDLTGNVVANVIANLITAPLLAIFVIVLNRFTVKSINAQTNILHKDWIGFSATSVFSTILSYLLVAYLLAVYYKWREWEMEQGLIYAVILVGAV